MNSGSLRQNRISANRQSFIRGMQPEKVLSKEEREQIRKDKKRIQQLESELHRKEKALAETAVLLVLLKKLNDYWGIPGGNTKVVGVPTHARRLDQAHDRRRPFTTAQ
ncbi:hypothetical protein P7C00_15215 [Pseudomonas sp. JDS08PS003]|nr:hypothetical protein [Pseudomonas orientalis]